MKVQISSAERVLTEWAQILDLELVAVGEMYAIKGQGEESQVLVEIGRMYGKSVFVIRKEENALEFLRALLEIEDVEMQTFRDTLYVRGLPKEVRGDFELAANALFPKVVFLSEEVNPKDPYTVQVSGFYITEKDLDQISLNAAKLTQGWQEVVLSWEEIGIIKELAKE